MTGLAVLLLAAVVTGAVGFSIFLYFGHYWYQLITTRAQDHLSEVKEAH
jgi:hypothetical protein